MVFAEKSLCEPNLYRGNRRQIRGVNSIVIMVFAENSPCKPNLYRGIGHKSLCEPNLYCGIRRQVTM